MLEISIREKHRILMRSVLSADKTPHTNKEEVYQYKVTACDDEIFLSFINAFCHSQLL